MSVRMPLLVIWSVAPLHVTIEVLESHASISAPNWADAGDMPLPGAVTSVRFAEEDCLEHQEARRVNIAQ
jgi:hypothetical protein